MSDKMSNKREKLIAKLLKKPGRAAAINAMCVNCIYDPDALGCGSWRQQVEDCTSTDCPLYKYRPLTTGANKEDEE
jgi:hypothetical protein